MEEGGQTGRHSLGSLELLRPLLFILLLALPRLPPQRVEAQQPGGRWVWVESSWSPPGCGSLDKRLTFSEPHSLICEMGILSFSPLELLGLLY